MKFLDADSVSAELSAQSIIVDVSDDQFPLLTVRYELRTTVSGDRRPLLLDFGECPLWPISIEGSEIESVMYDEQANKVLERISVHPRPGASWRDRSEITIRLRWGSSAPHPPLLGHAHLELPGDLPTIGRREIIRTAVCAQPPISLRGEVNQLLAGAISYSLDSKAEGRDPLLMAVLTRSSYVAVDIEQRDAQLRLLGNSKDDLSIANRRQIYSTVQQMSRFFGDKLGAHPGLRIMVDLDSTRETRRVSGPLVAQSLSYFRLPELKQSGHEFPIARGIAKIWWGAGVRIEGDEGIQLFIGMSFALGLAWAQSHAYKKAFDALLQFYRQRMISTPRFKEVEYRPGERPIGMGMVIYEALAERPRLWTTLQELTREYWGYYVPEDLVFARLEKGGVSRKDFARKRFRRTDIK